MSELLEINTWVNWNITDGFHRYALGICPYSRNGGSEGRIGKQCILFENPCLLVPNGQCPGEGLTRFSHPERSGKPRLSLWIGIRLVVIANVRFWKLWYNKGQLQFAKGRALGIELKYS